LICLEGEGQSTDRCLAGRGQRQALTPAVILVIALPEAEGKTEIPTTAIPLRLLPRQCPIQPGSLMSTVNILTTLTIFDVPEKRGRGFLNCWSAAIRTGQCP
jgi:hypothetical protein